MASPSNEAAGTPATAETLAGTVERVVYHDPSSRYTVLRVLVPGRDTLATVVGRSAGAEQGAKIELSGSWTVHPTHGHQFSFTHMKIEVPTTPAGIVRRLMRYPGIRDVIAQRIVDRFGLDTLSVLDEQPRRFLEVEGIGPRTLDRILDHHETVSGPVAELEAALAELEIGPHLADPIHRCYGDGALNVVRSQPYRLARDVRGVGFLTADRVARGLGIEADSPERIDAGLLHVLEGAESEGHTGVPVEWLVNKAAAALGVDTDLIRDGGERLVGAGDLVVEPGDDGNPLCFPHRFVVAEQAVARGLALLAATDHPKWSIPELPEHLSPGQVEAVAAVARGGVVVLTGGPGTGKSTVVRQILELSRRNDVPLRLAAPTGRAAKRLEQTTGESASTIHRLLEVQPESGRFTYGPENPLEPGLVVIDESSMLDVNLAQALIGALTPEHRLLLVGDADQLPSVGAGNVLRDVMAAAKDEPGIEVVRLTEVFRQAEGSSIVENAHRILAGRSPKADPQGATGEFFVVVARNADHARSLVIKMATERIPEAYGLDPRTEIQVLCPMHKGRAGTEALNRALQDHHTEGHPELQFGQGAYARRFRQGDRVMQIRNDYQKGVFNGDVGIVASVDVEAGRAIVVIDGVSVAYERRELGSLQLAYAVSIHKSQGSEFPAILVPILPEHHVMLRRNLLYTAVTRARRLCVVVGDPRAIDQAVRRADAARRHTGLRRRLVEELRAVLG